MTSVPNRRPADHDVRDRVIANTSADQFLSAGAGSGKTSVLVAHYLQVLRAEDVSPRQVVAVTFTNKAAAEMKERLREECRRQATDGDSDRCC